MQTRLTLSLFSLLVVAGFYYHFFVVAQLKDDLERVQSQLKQVKAEVDRIGPIADNANSYAHSHGSRYGF